MILVTRDVGVVAKYVTFRDDGASGSVLIGGTHASLDRNSIRPLLGLVVIPIAFAVDVSLAPLWACRRTGVRDGDKGSIHVDLASTYWVGVFTNSRVSGDRSFRQRVGQLKIARAWGGVGGCGNREGGVDCRARCGA